jgi:hypothetical protein
MTRLKITFSQASPVAEWNPIYNIVWQTYQPILVDEVNEIYAIWSNKEDWTDIIANIQTNYPSVSVELID